jgi:hypothetical protein
MKRISLVLWLGVFAALLIYLGFTVWLAGAGLVYPYQLDYGEGPLLDQARLLSQGRSIYKSVEGYPYAFSNYPPLLQTLAALLIPLLGVSYTAGRVWNVLAVFGLGALIYHAVRKQGGDRMAAAVAALFFVGSPYIYHWAPLFRIDLPGLLLSTLGVATVAAGGKTIRRDWSPCIAGLLFVLALYTKHSFFAAPAAAFAYLWLRDRAGALRLLGTLLALGGGAFIVLDSATAGAFYLDLVTANVNPFDFANLTGQIRDFAVTFAVMLGLALVAAVVRVSQVLRTGPGVTAAMTRLSAWDFYLPAALATVALAGKVGAWENYFFEPLFTVCLFAGLGASWLKGRSDAWSALLPAALLLQAGLMFHTPEVAAHMMAEDAVANQRLAPIVAGTRGAVLSEDMGLLVTNGKEIPFFGFEYTQLARMGLWDQSWELGMLRDRQFPLVILEAGTRENPDRYHRFTRQFLSELDRNYALTESIGRYRLYRPAPLHRELSAAFGQEVTLAGYRLDATGGAELPALTPGADLAVSLLWQAQRPMTTSYTVFVHFVDAQGRRLAQDDAIPFGGIYPTTRWAAGELVRDVHTLRLPADLAPGRYLLRVGLYRSGDQRRLPLVTGGDSLALAALRVGPPVICAPSVSAPQRLGADVLLSSYQIAPLAGGKVDVTLCWQADRYLASNYTVFVHLLAPDGKPVSQHDGPPTDEEGEYPTLLWEPGETVRDVHAVPVPPGLPPGEYQLVAGMYLPATGQRLGAGSGSDTVSLGTLTIR